MKKLLCLILVLLSAFCLFSSCKDNDHELDITKTGTKIYILRKDDDGRMYFDYEYVILKSEKREDRAKEMLEMLKNPGMDGAWMRSFDYEKWEYWGSAADIGWSAWSVETGWVNAWIATVLMLEERGESLMQTAPKENFRAIAEEIYREMMTPVF